MKRKNIKSCLVVDLNFIGDMLMSSPVMRCLKQNGVERLDVIAYDFCVPILEANPYIDNVYPVITFWDKLIRLLWGRKQNYDLIMQLNTSLKTNILMCIAGGKDRLGYDYRNRGFLNTIRIPITQRTARKGNRVRECLDLLEKGLGWTCNNEEMIYDRDSSISSP